VWHLPRRAALQERDWWWATVGAPVKALALALGLGLVLAWDLEWVSAKVTGLATAKVSVRAMAKVTGLAMAKGLVWVPGQATVVTTVRDLGRTTATLAGLAKMRARSRVTLLIGCWEATIVERSQAVVIAACP
jgi:hypothetical protein